MRGFAIVLLVGGMFTCGAAWCDAQVVNTRTEEKKCKPQVSTLQVAVVTGPYPLQATVTRIDYLHFTVDFKTEVGTVLHVTRAERYDLGALQVGDIVTLCIVEELHGDVEL
ncbi:MAG: hypothetical protein AB7G75_07970 [Candidatus Binatia bacterium]